MTEKWIAEWSRERKVGLAMVLWVAACAGLLGQQFRPVAPPAPHQNLPRKSDAKEIVRRSLNLDQEDFKLARDYTYQEREVLRLLDKKGEPKFREIYTNDVTVIYGEPYSRRILKGDKPLSAGEEKKEQEKLDKFMGKYKNENDQDRTRRLAQKERRREEGRAFVLDIINAYNFTNAGEEAVDGRETFVIVADPRNDFRPAQPHADVLRKLRGKIWIDQKNYGWVKVEAEAIDTISWGFFVLRIHKGSRIAFEQTRVNDEIWLPKRVAVNAGARFALLMNETFDWEATYSNYKKFTSSVRVLAGPGEVQR
ncbi:MAG: hypothetical protein DMG22_05385 [Acidobacteria bacterium]|nr:MAG: hypothetical protein DMG22_05385 [Acidobacteriota bacterium]